MSENKPCILLCTLGASWSVIPEMFGWLGPGVLDLYKHHPQRAALDELREKHALRAPEEIWLCTTEGEKTRESLDKLAQWRDALAQPVPIRIWTAAGSDQLATQEECQHMRELIFRATLAASERAGQLLLSLAGGRKTMSADLQAAGNTFGAHAMLHVISAEPLPPPLREADPQLFARALAPELAAAVTPLFNSAAQRDESLDVPCDEKTVRSGDYPLPPPASGAPVRWSLPAEQDALFQHLQTRQRESRALMGNFLADIAGSEHHENWRLLSRLPAATINALRATQLADRHLPWLQSIPKAELHCHIGGCLNLEAQKTVARAIWDACSDAEKNRAHAHIVPLLQQDEWPWDWPQTLKGQGGNVPAERARSSAALLLHASDAQLEHNLFAVTQPRLALKEKSAHGFAAYERPGELTGSAVLGHPAALAPYAAAIVQQARDDSILYLELRGSPHKYRPDDPIAFVRELRAALAQAGAAVCAEDFSADKKPRIGFLWILDRRQSVEQHKATVQQVQQARQAPQLASFLLGLDLAGDEAQTRPQTLAPAFTPAFEECLPITIHAGEGEQAENIWQAAYHLHADRIGHGLTLAEHAKLAARFRDRGICLELCPTSNREVIGYRDPAIAQSADCGIYPLRALMEKGIPLTLCTDNPGISRTTLSREYLAAARMSAGALTQWEALSLMRQGFLHAFLPAAERETLLKTADRKIFDLLAKNP